MQRFGSPKSLTFVGALIAMLSVSVASSSASDDEGDRNVWVRYTNERFGFSFAYPANVFSLPDRPPDNGDGQVFRTPDGKAAIGGSGGFNALDETLDDLWQRTLELVGGEKQVSYSKRGQNWLVVSGIHPPGRVFYRRQEIRDDVVFSVWMEYPEAQKKRFDPIVELVMKFYEVTADGIDTE